MPTASSIDSHSLTVTGASASAPSLLGPAHASKRTCHYDCELLSSATAVHLHQHDQDFEASTRPAKVRKSEMGTLFDSMRSLSDPDPDEASRPFVVHQQATNSCSDTQPFADKMFANAGLSSPAPSPVSHAPACHLPAIHVLTSGQVCTQFGSNIFVHDTLHDHVCLSALVCTAVAPHRCRWALARLFRQ